MGFHENIISDRKLSEKKEYIGIDFFKFFCSLLVVNIHVKALIIVNSDLDFWTSQVFCRIAVPFFFMASGYFTASKINSGKKIAIYIGRLFRLYLFYTILYLPETLYGWLKQGMPTWQYLMRQFLSIGINVVLWYFIALMIAVLMLYLLVSRLKMRAWQVLGMSFGAYVVGVLGQAYYKISLPKPVLGRILQFLYQFFGTMENAFLFGLFFVALGYYMNQYARQLNSRFGLGVILLLLVVVSVEGIFTRQWALKGEHAMLLTMPFLMVVLFPTVASFHMSLKWKNIGLLLRKMSVLIYGLHMLVDFYLLFFFNSILHIPLWSNPLLHYLVLILVTVTLAFMIVKVSEKKKFQWLKNLY